MADNVDGECAGAVPFGGVGRDLAFGAPLDRLAQGTLVLGKVQGEVD